MLHFYFLKKLNLLKIINILKNFFSYLISSILKKHFYIGNPISISLEPTTSCNLMCRECITGQRKLSREKGNMQIDLFKKVIDETYKYLSHCFLYFQGEPFLNKEIIAFIKYASSKNIFTATSSNGHFFDNKTSEAIVRSGLDKLIISLDGTNQEVYEKYRVGGDFQKVVEGIENLNFYKKKYHSKKPFLVIQFLVLGTNEHQLGEIKKLSKKLKVDKLELKSVQISDFKKNNILLPKTKKFQRYRIVENELKFKSKLKNRCWRLWNSIVITWNGDILPCCFDKDGKYKFGNINKEAISEIVRNKKAQQFRKRVLSDRKSIDICNNCTNI